MDFHFIESNVRYLNPHEGGRTDAIANGHRGQFHLGTTSYAGFQFFPDLPVGQSVEPGDTARLIVMFNRVAWEEASLQPIAVGMPFEVREFREVVAAGTVTKLAVESEDQTWVTRVIQAPKTASTTPICNCGMPDNWVDDPAFPVEFDERMNEYQIVHKGARATMWYCFWCGGRLPESRRGSFFTTPDESELAEVHQLLAGAKSVGDVIQFLGPPDETHKPGARATTERPSILAWKQQLDYRKRWKSLTLIVHEKPDGGIRYSWGGQWKGGRAEGSDASRRK